MNAQQAVLEKSPHIVRGMEMSAQGASVVVAPGECRVGGRVVKVTAPVTLPVAPAAIREVQDEALKLSVDKPAGWSKGTRLRGPNVRDVNAFGSLLPETLVIRRTKGGEILVQGEDYLVDPGWAHVGLGPSGRVTATDTVFASYRYSLLRMDLVQVGPDGTVSLKTGEPHISAPVPPAADAGCVPLAHLYVPYRGTEVRADWFYPILETAEQAVTGTTPGRIPKTMAKLRAGQPLKIVCWGDSVTAGGNASKPEFNYPNVFVAGLRERFPAAQIQMENISVGGSNSLQWLYPDKHKFRGLEPDATPCRFQRIVDAKPDLVTIEFVNDAGMGPAQVEQHYNEIMRRLNDLGAEVILITPHFTMWRMMGFQNMRGVEARPYVLALRAYAEKNNLALADAAARWEHQWKEGIPYLTLLHNTINHPDDRGHRLFAEELWKCFK